MYSAGLSSSDSSIPTKYGSEIKEIKGTIDFSIKKSEVISPSYGYFGEEQADESIGEPTAYEKLSTYFSTNPKFWLEDAPITTPLHEAVKKNSINDTKNKEGDTPLFIAIRNVCLESVCLLLEAGAVVGIKNKSDESPYSLSQDVILYRTSPGDIYEKIFNKIIKYDIKEKKIMRSKVY